MLGARSEVFQGHCGRLKRSCFGSNSTLSRLRLQPCRRTPECPKALPPWSAQWPLGSNRNTNISSGHNSASHSSQNPTSSLNNGTQPQQQQQSPAGNSLEASWHGGGGSGAAGYPDHTYASSTNGVSSQDRHVPGATALVAAFVTALGSMVAVIVNALDAAAQQLQVPFRQFSRFIADLYRPESRLMLEGCQLTASLLFILLYVWSTYTPAVAGGPRWMLDLVLSAAFAADYTHRMLVSSSYPLLAMLHPLAVIDLLSWAPSLVGAVFPLYVGPWGLDLRWFRVFRALRLLRLSLLAGNHSTMKSNRRALVAGFMNVPLVWLCASVIAWLFTSASCVAVMEKWVWHDALYFVTSTLTTVGYGDVVVKSSMGRLVVLAMMLIGVVLIPVRAGQLYSRLSERSLVAGHAPGAAPGCQGLYVVLSGRLSDVRGFNDLMQDFLVQVRHYVSVFAGRHQGSLQLVCLSNKPSAEFLALQELHESYLTLIEGSAFNEHDLIHRARLAGSTGVMVLADRFSTNADAEDTEVQFRVWAIKSAVKRVPLYVQVLRRQSVDSIAPFLDPHQDIITSVEGTRLRLLALSCFVPGASTLIANLLRSSGPSAGFKRGSSHASKGHTFKPWRSSSGSAVTSPAASLDGDSRSQNRGGTRSGTAANPQGWSPQVPEGLSSRDGTSSYTSDSGADGTSGMMAGRVWLREYADGAHCELFWCAAGAPLAGLRFCEAAEAVYEATGTLPVGLMQDSEQPLLLNPSSYVIRQGQQLIILAASRASAAAGAAGEGVEHTQIMHSLKTAAITAVTDFGDSSSGAEESILVLQQRQQREEARMAAGSSSSTARGVTVKVPGLSSLELQQFNTLDHRLQNSRQQQQQGADSGAVLPAAGRSSALLSLDLISQPGSSSGVIIQDEDYYADEYLAVLNPCIANWSGAYESDSIDETEICTEGEMLEAALLLRRQQQQREQQQSGGLLQQRHLLGQQQQQQQHALLGGTRSPSMQGQGSGKIPGNGSGPQRQAADDGGNSSSSSSSSTQATAGLQATAQQGQPQGDGFLQHSNLQVPAYTAGPRRRQHHQQQQPHVDMPSPPVAGQLNGHVIIAGSASEFLPFAEQLHSIAPPNSTPVTIVIMHPEPPPDDIYKKISNLGPIYYVRGKTSESAALAAAQARYARSLTYLGPSERPAHVTSQAVSGIYGDPTSRDVHSADYTSTNRTAVLADADALGSCYGVGEALLPDTLHTVVELGFTSSIRFLQPGLLLHGRPAPQSAYSCDDADPRASMWGAGFWTRLTRWLRLGGADANGNSSKRHRLIRGSNQSRDSQDQGPGSSSSSSGNSTPSQSYDEQPHPVQRSTHRNFRQQPSQPSQQQQHRQPRSSWRHRKEIEEAGRQEGLIEWQLNSYYAAGRVMVPAQLDTFTIQGFCKRRALLELLTELAGDDGRPGGAMLWQMPVPQHLVGCGYKDMVKHFLTAQAPQERYVCLGLLRRKSENWAWRLPYVATHPDPDTVLRITDAVFVIRPQ